MIQIVRTEGVSNAVCLVTLDSDQINLCDNGHYLNHHGVLSLQFVVGSRLMAGVMFPSHLLQNNNCQYVPLFDPPLYIDNFPDEVEPPRVLISYAKLNADHNQGPMTERETQAEDSINLDNFEDNCTKKKIYDLEMELENARIDHQIEIGKVKRTMQDAIDELIAKQAKADIMYKNQQIVSLDIANQRNTFKKMLDNKTQFSDKFEDFSSKILVEHETELKVREK